VSETRLRLTEIYRSIQGESTFAGEPCIFVRTTGCNLRCTWCDSAYTFTGGRWWTLEAVLAEVSRLGPGLVEVTGGEPLLQDATIPLMAALVDAGRTVLLETSGSLPVDRVPSGVHRIVDLKAPASGEVDENLWANLARLGRGDEVKVVVADRTDYEWARSQMREHALADRVGAVLLSPVHGTLDAATLAEWILADALPARLNLQLHKVLWPDADRGV